MGGRDVAAARGAERDELRRARGERGDEGEEEERVFDDDDARDGRGRGRRREGDARLQPARFRQLDLGVREAGSHPRRHLPGSVRRRAHTEDIEILPASARERRVRVRVAGVTRLEKRPSVRRASPHEGRLDRRRNARARDGDVVVRAVRVRPRGGVHRARGGCRASSRGRDGAGRSHAVLVVAGVAAVSTEGGVFTRGGIEDRRVPGQVRRAGGDADAVGVRHARDRPVRARHGAVRGRDRRDDVRRLQPAGSQFGILGRRGVARAATRRPRRRRVGRDRPAWARFEASRAGGERGLPRGFVRDVPRDLDASHGRRRDRGERSPTSWARAGRTSKTTRRQPTAGTRPTTRRYRCCSKTSRWR